MIFARMITDNLYAVRIHVAIGPLDEFKKYFAERTDFKRGADTQHWGDSLGKTIEHTYENGGCEFYVWFPGVAAADTIAHESFHLTYQIMRARTIYLSRDSEEAYAYYLSRTFIELAGAVAEYADHIDRHLLKAFDKWSATLGSRRTKKKTNAPRLQVRRVRRKGRSA